MYDMKVYEARSGREAITLLERHPGSLLIAGGTDLVVKLKEGRIRGSGLIGIDKAGDLRIIEVTGDRLCIGSCCTHSEIIDSRLVKRYAPLLAFACSLIGSVQVRNRGTIGGNLATASPAGDTIPALLAMDARVICLSPLGRESMSVGEFLLSPGRTALGPSQIIERIEVPMDGPDAVWAMRKLGQRKAMSIAVASVAVHARLEAGVLRDVRIAVGSCAPTVVRAERAEKLLEGLEPNDATFEEAGEAVEDCTCPICDIRGTEAYRRTMARALTRQALMEMVGRSRVHQEDEDTHDAAADGAGATITEVSPEYSAIVVHVELLGPLKDAVPGGSAAIDLKAGASVRDLIDLLTIDDKAYVVALVNMRRVDEDYRLSHGDHVKVMNPVGGGA